MGDRDHVDEIDRVLGGVCTGRDAVVAQSWRRCVETYGLDPTRPSPAHIVSDAKLRTHREQSERLIAIARSGLEALFRQVAGQNYVLLLADAQGVTVDFFGDARFEDELRRAGLYLGADWSEEQAGTCGVGACIVTQEAVTIHQTDHFDFHHTTLSCTAAPIFDTTGQLSAVLDISLLRSPQPKISQNLAMSLVQASARRVEMANLMATSRSDWVLRFSSMPEFLEVDPDAAIVLDGSGRIIGLTRGAQQLLSDSGGPILGQRIDALLDVGVDDLPELMRGRAIEERVVRLHDGRALFGHAIAPQAARGLRAPPAVKLPGALLCIGGSDPVIQQLQADAARLAATTIPVLITGETGTGKERLARAIHVCQTGDRPFVAVNCAGLSPETLRAALSGEDQGSAGIAAAADGGTLFLDEVGDLSPEVQARLLRLLAEGEPGTVTVGGAARVRLRVMSATQEDLAARVRAGTFRSDLFFRLAGARLHVPPLRLRQDFDWLLDRLVRQRSHGRPDVPAVSAAARAALHARPWPGNIRELMHTIDVAMTLGAGPVIHPADLPGGALDETSEAEDPRATLEAVLCASGGNMADAARRLGVNRSTVLRRARRLGLVLPQ